ncbi:MAG: RidA family protein [Alphaproteobacteria bacterium]|nr:RidA family protein [Alphaproteobacteria bacterium]
MGITRINPGMRYCATVVHNDTVYIAGQVADTPAKKDITAQTKDVLRKVEAAVKAGGSSKKKILTMQIYLSDMRDFAGMNAVYDKWVDKANKPTRATVESRLATPDYKIEIVAVAAK